MVWTSTFPTSGSKMLITPVTYQGNWDVMDDILEEEHYGMTSSLSGRHKPGYVGAMYVSANADVAGLSPQSGAMAWVTNTGSGMGLIRGASAWKRAHYDLPITRVLTYGPTSMTVALGTYGFFLSGGTESVDTLGEWDNTTGIFSAAAVGYFLFSTSVTLSTTNAGGDAFSLGFSGTGLSASSSHTSSPSAEAAFSYSALISVGSGVGIAPYVYCAGTSLKVSGGSEVSYCKIYRIS